MFPHSPVVAELLPAFLMNGKGGEGNVERAFWSHPINPISCTSRQDSGKTCRKVAGNAYQVWGRSGKVEEIRQRNLILEGHSLTP